VGRSLFRGESESARTGVPYSPNVAELPSGTVTFLFTDIEGSTRLLRRLGEGYASLLEEHQRLLREAFEEAGGQEIDTQGDAFFVAFRRAKDAVAAAAAGQRALTAHEWPEGVSVRVRMGLHTGEPVVSPDRYVGMGVHRGARICAAGHGGQVLLSNATRELIEDELPTDLSLKDLGEHRLKDIDRPERLFQLVIEGLPADFPPLRSVEAEVGPFGGQEEKLEEAAVAAVGRFPRRRRLVAVGAAAAVVAGATIIAVVVLGGGSGAGATAIGANSVGLVNGNNGSVKEQVEVESAPTGVAIGEGAVWVTNTNDASVSRVDPETGTVRQTIAVGNSPAGIALGGGSVWVANHDDGTLDRIDPTTNTVVQPIRVGNGPTAVAFGAGAVWVTNADDRTLSKIDPLSGTRTRTIRTDAVSRGVAVGAGSVWVTDESTKSVLRIDPRTGDVTDTVSVGNGPSGIAYGGGSVWVTNSLDGTVSRIDPATVAVTATIRVGSGPAAIAAEPGAVWVSVEFGNRLVKIDPRGSEPRIASTVDVKNRPKGLAVGEDGIWVAVQASGNGHRGGRLVVMTPALGQIDPAAFASNFDPIAQGLVFDGLTAVRRTGGGEGTQIVPDLAETLPSPTDGRRTWTFRLRHGIRYSTGRPVAAEDIRRGLERIVAAGAGGPVPTDSWKIVGAERCTARHCDLSRSVAVGKDTVTIHLTEPNPRLPLLLASAAPAPAGTPLGAVRGRVPGTGPYMVESYVQGREARFVRNPYFHVWSAAARPDGYPDEIVWRLGPPSDDKIVANVEHGVVDVFPQSSPQRRLEELRTRYPSLMHPVPQKATAFLFLNTRQSPFDDVRVRQAVNLAIDRAKVASLHGGEELARPTCQLVPPSLPGYAPYCPYTTEPDATGAWKAPDLERAKRLIVASGTRGQRVVVWTFPYFGAEARYVVSLLQQLGYRAQLKEISDFNRYFTTITSKHPQAGLAGWFYTLLPSDMFSTLACNAPVNYADFCDRGFDRRVAALRRTEVGDQEEAANLTERLDREAVDKAPWVPLFTPQLIDLVSKRVGNYQSNPYNGTLLDQLWVR
jgi:YVTN family beta-propeller protein